jgi:hypothetical protein
MLKKVIGLLLFASFSAILFLYYNHVQIDSCKYKIPNKISQNITLPFSQYNSKSKNITYTCNIQSNLSQSAVFGIKVDDEIISISLNNSPIDLTQIKNTYKQNKLKDWSTGYPLELDLNSGDNKLIIESKDYGGNYGLSIAKDLSSLEFIILFFTVILPLFYLLYYLFFLILKHSKQLFKITKQSSLTYLPILIIIVGILLRLHLVNSVPNSMYQHDYAGHKAAILYYSENPFTMPQADKNLQFPQQPLYYISTGIIHNIGVSIGFQEKDTFFAMRIFSVFLSLITLIIGLRLVKIYTSNTLSINLFIAFLALTPSFIFMGARVNNDILNMTLGIASVYLISLYYLKPIFKYFFIIMILIILSLLTKISSLLFAIWLIFIMFIHHYKYQRFSSIQMVLQKRFFWIGIVVLFFFGLSVLKVYLPTTGELRFINSALFSGQIIPRLDLSYFTTFHWFDLIKEAQSYSFGSDDIRFSFFTYQYGTMLTGEYIYAKYFAEGGLFKLSTQIIYILGIIYVLGLALYLYSFHRFSTIKKLLVIPLLINMLLIVKLLTDYWDVCNSDFRYYSPIFSTIGLIFVLGLEQIHQKYPRGKTILISISIVFFIIQIYWILKLISLS